MTNPDTIFLDGKLLACFCAAAEELHFGRAATRLFMSQPPFSQQIKRLEALVGAPLFVRTTRSVRLTPAGQLMYTRARQIAGDTTLMLRAVRQAARGEAGALAIGLTPSAACSPLAETLYGYRVAHPGIELDLREMNSNTMEAALRQRSIDVALMRPTQMDADIESTTVFEEPMLLAIRRDHPFAALPRVALEQVADIPLIGYTQAVSPYFRRMLQAMFARIGRRPRVVQESVVPTLLTLVEAGVGAAIVPWTISRGRSDALLFLPLLDRSHTTASIVVASLRAQPNAAVEGFVAALRQAAGARGLAP
ncbi:MAG: LysR substrate-binding domain-containing protein [Pseudomonadota bacterium]